MQVSTLESKNHFVVFMAAFGVAALVVIGCADFGSGPIPLPDDGGVDEDTVVVSFAAHVLPIFQVNCNGNGCHSPCHSFNGGGLCLASHATLISANVLTPGDSANSLIVRYLDGRESPRMPNGRLPLPDTSMKLIRNWIAQGASDN